MSKAEGFESKASEAEESKYERRYSRMQIADSRGIFE